MESGGNTTPSPASTPPLAPSDDTPAEQATPIIMDEEGGGNESDDVQQIKKEAEHTEQVHSLQSPKTPEGEKRISFSSRRKRKSLESMYYVNALYSMHHIF